MGRVGGTIAAHDQPASRRALAGRVDCPCIHTRTRDGYPQVLAGIRGPPAGHGAPLAIYYVSC